MSSFRLPLRSEVLPLAGAFAAQILLYRQAGEGRPVSAAAVAAGLFTFVLLFVQLRLVDDLDDVRRDHSAGAANFARRRLVATLAAVLTALVLLDRSRPLALAASLTGSVLTYAAPFAFKRCFPRSLAAGSLLFEGAPFVLFAYPYFWWRDASASAGASPATVVLTTGAFWAGYEFWKFSRKIHQDTMQPYFLSKDGVRLALHGFLAVSLLCNVWLARVAGLSPLFYGYGALLPLGFAMWLNSSWQQLSRATARPAWAGMPLVLAVEAGLIGELASRAARAGGAL